MCLLPVRIGLLFILFENLENLPLLPPDSGPILPLPNGFDPAWPGMCCIGPIAPPLLLWANECPKLPCLYDGDCFARCVNCISGTAFGAPYSFSAAGA